jgi:alpha-D-ribose 1-methylphosphonate 5-triphosphate synthase subunit PhnI
MMPVVRVQGGYKAHAGASKVHRRRRDAQRQLQAIKIHQARQAKGRAKYT